MLRDFKLEDHQDAILTLGVSHLIDAILDEAGTPPPGEVSPLR